MIVKNCRICNNQLSIILDLGNQPLANSLKSRQNSIEEKYKLELLFCKTCKALQISKNIDLKKLFHSYVWNTGISKSAKIFSQKFYEISIKKISKFVGNPKQENKVLEIASNDGTFLSPFKKNGFSILGVDPAKNIVEISKKKKISVFNDFFNLNVSKIIKKKYGLFNYIFARNVIPHNPDVNDIIKGIKNILSINGLVSIEFHYLKNIFNDNQYDAIYHEHIFYFSLLSIKNLLNYHDLIVVDAEISPISGGSLIVFAQKKKLKPKISSRVENLLMEEKKVKLNNFANWKIFKQNVINHKEIFVKKYQDLKKQYKRICFYGASARSSTFLNFTKINFDEIICFFDKSSFKVNKFSPGSSIKILSLEDIKVIKPDLIIVLAWNFFDEIVKDLVKNYHYKNDLMIAYPKPKIYKYEDYTAK